MTAPAKKPVHSSHLALRFYKAHGWTKEILDPYLKRGRVLDQYGDQAQRDYWWIDHEQGSQLDMDRLYAEQVSKVFRWYEGEPRESDIEYMKKMNW